FILSNYAQGWEGFGGHSFGGFIKNSLMFVVFVLIGHLISCSLIAFGFARLNFVGSGFWFAVMIFTLMLPGEVVMVPQYIIFSKLGWLNSLKPLVVPAYFGHPFFIFLLVQSIRTIPREFVYCATLNGASVFTLYFRINFTVISVALSSTALFP